MCFSACLCASWLNESCLKEKTAGASVFFACQQSAHSDCQQFSVRLPGTACHGQWRQWHTSFPLSHRRWHTKERRAKTLKKKLYWKPPETLCPAALFTAAAAAAKAHAVASWPPYYYYCYPWPSLSLCLSVSVWYEYIRQHNWSANQGETRQKLCTAVCGDSGGGDGVCVQKNSDVYFAKILRIQKI